MSRRAVREQRAAARREPTPGAGWRGSKLFRQGALRAALVANAYRPSSGMFTMAPSFFASWLTTEAAPGMLAMWKVRTAVELIRRRRRGESLGLPEVTGLALTAGAAIGAVGLIRQGMRSDEEYAAALSGLIPAEELAARPAALRAGALVPLLTGNRRRRRTRNVVYTPHDAADPRGARLKLDVYLPLEDPEPGTKRPAVLQIHGGAWVLGSKDEQGIPLLNHLASCGWVGFNVDYRLSPRAKFPDHLVDCKKALAWIREHADEYGVDPDFIVVTGGSAGGHLCALMALTQNDPQFQPGFEDADTSLQAAVPFYGVYDLTDRDGNYNSTFVRLMTDIVMGVGLEDSPEAWAAYSPHGPHHRGRTRRCSSSTATGRAGAGADRAQLRRPRCGRCRRQPVVYAELHGAQHAFEVFPSFRTVHTVEYVERFVHHVHAEYLERATDPEIVEPVPDDDPDAEPAHAGEAVAST